MNEKFYELPEEKQLKIINAALEVFSKNEYKRAVTDDIAAKAGISKGLLFYYFKNKKNLYMFLYKYCGGIIKEEIINERFYKIEDFFELMEYSGQSKCDVLKRFPYIYEFTIRAYFSQMEEVSQKIYSQKVTLDSPYFKNIDFSKFRDDADVEKILNLIMWAMIGYYGEKQRMNRIIEIDEVMKEYSSWLCMLKKMSYKEEYL